MIAPPFGALMHAFILLSLASSGAAFASSHEDTLGYSTSDTSFEDECWVDVVTATSDVMLTKAEAYVDENDTSSTPKVYMWYWTRIGTGAWSRSTALGSAITVSSSSAGWVSTSTLAVSIDAGTTYAIGYCTTYTIDGYYSTSTAGIVDPVWGTYEGYTG
jgi:hypothetical protein